MDKKLFINRNYDADNHADACKYMKSKILIHNIISNENDKPIQLNCNDGYVEYNDGNGGYSFYILKSQRNKGLYKELIKKYNPSYIITDKSCDLVYFLENNDIYYVLPRRFAYDESFDVIEKYYGNKVTKRTQLPLINHIIEGMYIINDFCNLEPQMFNEDVRIVAHSAYCLHPITQGNIDFIGEYFKDLDLAHESIRFASQYAVYANSYLSKHYDNRFLNIDELIQNKVVKLMLIADKIQNYKDFYYNKENLLMSDEKAHHLDNYFRQWFDILEIDYDLIHTYNDKINKQFYTNN